MGDKHRVHGVIESVEGPHDNNRGALTTWVHLKLTTGFYQGVGGLILNAALADDYVCDLCTAFNVRAMDELVGKECYALYSFDSFNALIEGLESVDTGRRFIHTAWRRKHFPETRSNYDQEVERITSEIAWAERRAEDGRRRLRTLSAHYVEWETIP